MNTLYNQMLSAIADIEQGENKEVALTFLKVATTLLDAQNDLIIEFVREADDKVTDLLQQNDKFVSAHRAAHAFGHDCRQALSDRKELLDVAAEALKRNASKSPVDILAEILKGLAGNVTVMSLDELLEGDPKELFDKLFGRDAPKEKPKFH
ncbi:hypothetical protein FDJ62_gp40 [Acinetobacter phage Loki]|uniref:Uncharacterized protein n=1 Tax=Acinetobacter phage Loki TaxID=1970374 RepID=A0A0P1KKL4_9CAUD|nr:hypothetical protein FDJ62_gp40 [Acinetobacter phage Loki]CUS06501.1 hypothetical protein [Acinetobacter phage Loki]